MKQLTIVVVVLLLFALIPGPLASQPVKAESSVPSAQNLIIIVWDGLQRQHLLEMLRAGEVPNLKRLIDKKGLGLPKIVYENEDYHYNTATGPGNSAAITGLGYMWPPPGMQNRQNKDPHPIPDGLTLFEYFKAKSYSTGLVSTKHYAFWPYVPLTNAKPEIDFWRVAGEGQGRATKRALHFIQTAEQPFFLWLHYREPDELGHQFGENSQEYSESIKKNDRMLGRLLQSLQRQGLLRNTLVVITTDHGFTENGHGHGSWIPDNRNLFLVVSRKPKVLACVHRQTDLAPCLKRLF